ncbi:MAG: hypothetical protein ACKV2T_12345 [Kofleriaceae bacterium]
MAQRMKHFLLLVTVLGACSSNFDEGVSSQSVTMTDGSPDDSPEPPDGTPNPPADEKTPKKEPKFPVDEKGKLIPGGLEPGTIDAPGWWEETDGIKPEVPGCHYAYKDEATCKGKGKVIGWLGEYCERDKEKKLTNILVETNPDPAGKCHFHEGGKGHPDRIDCDKYCKGTYGEMAKGTCLPVDNVCDGEKGKIASAKCECEKPAAPLPEKKEPTSSEDDSATF